MSGRAKCVPLLLVIWYQMVSYDRPRAGFSNEEIKGVKPKKTHEENIKVK